MGALTYQQEPLAQVIDEIKAFLTVQWAHTGDADLECAPNWTMYGAMEVRGVLALLTVREDARFIGYLVFVVHPHVNSTLTQIATIATYFVEPRPNRALVLRRLFDQALAKARHIGVRQVKIKTEFHNSCGRLLEAMGFEPEEIGYKLRLSGATQEARRA